MTAPSDDTLALRALREVVREAAAAMTLTIVLPCPPSTNKMWRFVPGMKSPLKSSEYRKWWSVAVKAARRAADDAGQSAPILEDVTVSIAARRPHATRDLDNLAKAVLDVLGEQRDRKTKEVKGAAIYCDDRQVTRLVMEWSRGSDGKVLRGDKVTVRVRPFENPAELKL